MLNANQGTKDAGNQWYILLKMVLEEYSLVRSTTDHGLFVKKIDEKHYLYIVIATDDLLAAFHSYNVFHDVVTYLKRFFVLSIQTGGVI